MPWLEGIGADLRQAVRASWRSPGFTLTAVATLALGIGVNVAVFTVTNAVLFKGFRSVEGNDRVLYIDTYEQGGGCCVSYPDFEDWRSQAVSFEGMGTVADLRITLTDGSGFAESYSATQVSANAFQVLGRSPILGRDFAASDASAGAAPVAILRHAFWQRRFGGDPEIIGRAVRINGVLTSVVGVMPEGFSFPQNQDLWLPLTPTPEIEKRQARGLWFAFGRLAEGVTIESARTEMEVIGRRLASAYPETNQGFLPRVRNFHQFFVGPNAAAIYGALLGAVGFVLLIACANLANLLLARAIGRSREVSVRIALGASRWRIVRQLLAESLTISVVGGVCGWWLARLGVLAYARVVSPPSWFENVLDYTLDYRVLAYAVVVSIGTGVLFGLAPASRLSKLDVQARLKDGGRGVSVGGRGKRLADILVVAETALAMVLLAGAGLMTRSFLNIYAADPGVKTENVVTALLRLPDVEYGGGERIAFFDSLTARMEAIPGVESIATADTLPTWGARRLPYELAGASAVDERLRPKVAAVTVSPNYFRTVGAPLLSGREFAAADGGSAPPVAIVNQRAASAFWPGREPLGMRIRLGGIRREGGEDAELWLTVVGVVTNIGQNDSTRQRIDPVVYVPYRRDPVRAMWVLARTDGPSRDIGSALRREVQSLDAELPIWLGPFELADRLAVNYRSTGVNGGLFLIFAAIALLLASAGLYAVISHALSRRTQELAIRMAIGASTGDILHLVLRHGLRPPAVGLLIGLAGSLAVNQILRSELVQVSPTDPLTLTAASAALALAVALGCWLPARRAMRVNPAVALRQE